MNTELVDEIANAILYEGYILYPYRATAVKNRQRWNFGVVYPPNFARQQSGADSWLMQTEFLARGGPLRAQVRFLHLIDRITLDKDGSVVNSWQEAVERRIELEIPDFSALLGEPRRKRFSFPAGEKYESEQIVRKSEALQGMVQIGAEKIARGWFRLRLTVANAGFYEGDNRDEALSRSFVSTHAILHLEEGRFASLLDPPPYLEEAAKGCQNTGSFPVMVGDPGSTDAMLCSPIILYDYPQIAPQSAGSLFDGTEIDEILSLRILALTDEEKQEMREVDGFARRILERTEALTPEQFINMHGVMRPVNNIGETV